MSVPSNGITADVIRDIMPPYQLSHDLLVATFAALPPPPPDATTAWRHARATRLIEEIARLLPADAAQARLAAQILTLREAADTLTARLHAPDATIEQMCRLARASADLARTANALERSLQRHQQKPVPFYGTVLQDAVDIAAVAAVWHNRTPAAAAGPSQRPPSPAVPAEQPAPTAAPPRDPAHPAAAPAAHRAAVPPQPAPDGPDAAPPPADTHPTETPTPTRQPANPTTIAPAPRPDRSAAPVTRRVLDGGKPTDWEITRLDEGPGWTREVLRHRPANAAGTGPASGRDLP